MQFSERRYKHFAFNAHRSRRHHRCDVSRSTFARQACFCPKRLHWWVLITTSPNQLSSFLVCAVGYIVKEERKTYSDAQVLPSLLIVVTLNRHENALSGNSFKSTRTGIWRQFHLPTIVRHSRSRGSDLPPRYVCQSGCV